MRKDEAMKFIIYVYSDDGTEVDYSNERLTADASIRFINGWQEAQDESKKPACQYCNDTKIETANGVKVRCRFCGKD